MIQLIQGSSCRHCLPPPLLRASEPLSCPRAAHPGLFVFLFFFFTSILLFVVGFVDLTRLTSCVKRYFLVLASITRLSPNSKCDIARSCSPGCGFCLSLYFRGYVWRMGRSATFVIHLLLVRSFLLASVFRLICCFSTRSGFQWSDCCRLLSIYRVACRPSFHRPWRGASGTSHWRCLIRPRCVFSFSLLMGFADSAPAKYVPCVFIRVNCVIYLIAASDASC